MSKDRACQQHEEDVVLNILRAAYEKPFRAGSVEIAFLSVDDVVFVAESWKERIGRSRVLAALKRLHDDCKVARCLCCDAHLHWRYVHLRELAAISRGNA